MDKEILIQKFLHGTISEEEQLVLAKSVENDLDLKERLEIESVFYAQRNLALKDELKSETTALKTDSSTKYILRALLLLGILAILISTGLYLFNQKSKEENTPELLVAEYLSRPFEAPPTPLGEKDKKEDLWEDAMTAYASKDFPTAINSILKIENRIEIQELYLGLSFLFNENQDLSNSLKSFNKVFTNPNGEFKDVAQWYIALNLFKQGKEKEAEFHLTQIVENDSWQNIRARKLLEAQ